ncbi:DUF599 domain-containing protein [Pelomonas sp. HMWF004]|nr:DUF599 domain-containing protein [Pelomonas sp. HMWF004]
MSPACWAVLATVLVLLAYEGLLWRVQRRHPERLARSVHALLREQWFEAVSAVKGSEILAVQTLRNSLMSATMLASTAALGLMGTLTLAVPTLHADTASALVSLTPQRALALGLLAVLLGSLVTSVMSVRFYQHAGYVAALPVGSAARERWGTLGAAYLRKAGLLYSWGLRHLMLVVPLVAALLLPLAGPVAAVVVVVALYRFDRVGGVPAA